MCFLSAMESSIPIADHDKYQSSMPSLRSGLPSNKCWGLYIQNQIQGFVAPCWLVAFVASDYIMGKQWKKIKKWQPNSSCKNAGLVIVVWCLVHWHHCVLQSLVVVWCSGGLLSLVAKWYKHHWLCGIGAHMPILVYCMVLQCYGIFCCSGSKTEENFHCCKVQWWDSFCVMLLLLWKWCNWLCHWQMVESHSGSIFISQKWNTSL